MAENAKSESGFAAMLALPEHLQRFKEELERMRLMETVKLPLLQQLSPRTRKRIALLPAPNKMEQQQIENFLDASKEISKDKVYDRLIKGTDKSRANAQRLNVEEDWEIMAKKVHEKKLSLASTTNIRPGSRGGNTIVKLEPLDHSCTSFYDNLAITRERYDRQQQKLKELDSQRVILGSTSGGSDAVVATSMCPKSSDIDSKGKSKPGVAYEPKVRVVASPARKGKLNLMKNSSIGGENVTQTEGIPLVTENRKLEKSRSVLDAYPFDNSLLKDLLRDKGAGKEKKALFSATLGSTNQIRAPKMAVKKIPVSSGIVDPYAAIVMRKKTAKHRDLLEELLNKRESKPQLQKESCPTAPEVSLDQMMAGSTQASVSRPMSKTKSAMVNTASRALLDEYKPILDAATRFADQANVSLKQQQELVAQSKIRQQRRLVESQHFKDYVRTSAYDEMGVDLDKNYTRGRLLGRYAKTLVYFYNLCRQMNAFSWLKLQTARASASRIQWAVTTIQRCGRGLVGRSNIREIKRNLYIQRQYELQLELEQKQLERRCGLTIYVLFRCNSIKVRRVINRIRLRAAVLIQKRIRGILGRHRAVLRREFVDYLNYHCTKIQCCFRRVSAMKLLVLMRKLDYVRQWMENIDQIQARRRQSFMEQGAALQIQRAYAASVIRRRIQNMLFWNRMEKTIHIQRMGRGFVARCKCRRMLKEQRIEADLRCAASILIQKHMRRCLIVMVFNPRIRREREAVREKRIMEKQLKMQGRGKPLLMQRFMKRFYPFYYVKEKEMAIRIQKVYRGHKARKRAFMVRCVQLCRSIADTDKRLNKAVVDMQRVFRGYINRVKSARRRKIRMSIIIQCAFRCLRARRRVKSIQLKTAAGEVVNYIIGEHYRRYKRKIEFRRIMKLTPFIVRIQCFLRAHWLARRRVKAVINSKRQVEERRQVANSSLLRVIAGYQLHLISESYNRPIGTQGTEFCGKHCYGFGPIQGLFLFALGSRARSEMVSIQSNKIDSKQLTKLLQKVPKLCHGSRAPSKMLLRSITSPTLSRAPSNLNQSLSGSRPRTPANLNCSGALPSVDFEDAEEVEDHSQKCTFDALRNLALWEVITLGMLPIPAGTVILSQTDIDLVFSRYKDPLAGNMIGYSEFITCLNYLGKEHFHNERIDLSRAGSNLPSPKLSRMNTSSDVKTVSRMGSTSDLYGGKSIGSMGILTRTSSAANLTKVVLADVREKVVPLNSLMLADALVDRSYTTRKEKELMALSTSGTSGKKQKKQHGNANITVTWDNSNMPIPTLEMYGMALAVKILMGLVDTNANNMLRIFEYLEEESRFALGEVAKRIQKLARSYLKRKFYRALRISKAKEKKDSMYSNKVILCQCVVRRFVARQRVAHMAQAFIHKYIPFTGEAPYYVNPSTRISSWVKPKILREYDALSVPLPAPGLENVVTCGNCTSMATCNCTSCDDSMCKNCFETLHCKGKRKVHCRERIPFCGYCKFQLATKDCLSCTLMKTNRSSPVTYMSGDKGRYCDTCFVYYHDPCEHVESMKQYSRAVLGIGGAPAAGPGGGKKGGSVNASRSGNGITNNGIVIKDAYLIRQLIKRPLITSHTYDNLVQACEECLWRSALWRCNSCDQVYCNTCLIGLHSIGGPFGRHKAEVLPYYTPSMHSRFEEDAMRQRLQRRIDRVARLYAKRRQELKMKCTIKLQTWWRMLFYGRRGRQEMVYRRRRLRRAYKQYKREDQKFRNKRMYKFLDFFGYAPSLPTDTREQQALRHINIFRRERAREYIYKNKEDWGYYVGTDAMPPRKGIYKRGFDVGFIEELKKQAEWGGYRYPGRVLVEYSKNQFTTTTDLRGIAKVGSIVRLHFCYFMIIDVGDRTITLDRKWRFEKEDLMGNVRGAYEDYFDDNSSVGSAASQVFLYSDSGVIMYRMPSIERGEAGAYYHAFKYYSYEIGVGNPIASGYLDLHVYFARKLVKFGLYMTKLSKKDGQISDAKSWKKWAAKCELQIKWAESFMIEPKSAYMDRKTVAEMAEEMDEDYAAHMTRVAEEEELALKKKEEEKMQQAEKPEEEDMRMVGGYWIAPPAFIQKRNEEENKLTRDELIALAENWVMELDPHTEVPIYKNHATKELSYDIPNPVKTKQLYEEEQARNVAQFAEAQKRINAMNDGKKKKKKM